MTDTLLVLIAVLALTTLAVTAAAFVRLRSVSFGGNAAEGLASIPGLGADIARLRDDLQRSEQAARTDAAVQRQELNIQLSNQRGELNETISRFQTATEAAFGGLRTALTDQVEQLTTSIGVSTTSQTTSLATLQQTQATAADSLRTQVTQQLAATRGEITTAVGALSKENSVNLNGIADRVSTQLSNQAKDVGDTLEKLRTTVDAKLASIQTAADAKLEEMRMTVDEKLSRTLDTRLGENFRLVSERLEAVQTGLGEMKSLAGNVTDLRRVMTNVKTRGIWGEVQLANLLDQIFTQEQYEANFKPKARGGEVVEFALKLPGPEGSGSPIYLPIDSKFPIEDYQRLAEAAEAGDVEGVKAAQKALENRIYGCAKDIRDKYIAVPTTTNFAVLFLPTEGLYAEVIKMPGLMENLIREYKVVVQGPTTFSAFAMALLMGFRTLAIQKRSAEIEVLLGAVKSDFGKFSDLLGKVEEKLDDAKTNIGKARQRSTQIVKKLGRVAELPKEQTTLLLPDPLGDPDAVVENEQD